MATIFLDSANHYADADVLMKYSAVGSTAWQRTALGRTGTYCLYQAALGAGFAPSFLDSTLRLNLTANYARLTAGAAFKFRANYSTGGGDFLYGKSRGLFAFADTANCQVSLMVGPDMSLVAFAGFSTDWAFGNYTSRGITILGRTAPGVVKPATWNYIEIDVTFNSAVGAVTVYVNGKAVLTLTNVNTSPYTVAGVPTNQANQFGLISAAGNGTEILVGDIYLVQGAGAYGDVSNECLFPTGAGTATQWTPSAGANWQCVDEATPNGDTDYVEDSTPGDRDTYAMGNLSGGITSIASVQNIVNARKTDSAARVIASVIRSGGTNYDGANMNLSSAYLFYWQDYDTDPNTAAAWTTANVNAVEAGEKMIS